MILYSIGTTQGCIAACKRLKQVRAQIVDHPTPEVTHLLLDVPSFDSQGLLRSGTDIVSILERLPEDITVIGGNLQHPSLQGYRKIDLLQDPNYLAKNAAITADCALRVAAPVLKRTFSDSSILIIGWGRIGKCLAQLLHSVNADVTVAARKEVDRAMIQVLGCKAVDIPEIPGILGQFQLLFNTVPEMVISQSPPGSCICIELASKNGISGENVISARGLPAKYAPESTGQLIAQTIIHYCKEDIL